MEELVSIWRVDYLKPENDEESSSSGKSHFEGSQRVPYLMSFGSLRFPVPNQEMQQQGFSKLHWILVLDLAVLVGADFSLRKH